MRWFRFKDNKKTRYTLTVYLAMFLCIVCVFSLATNQTEVATKTIDALMVLVPVYILGDTLRRSNEKMGPFIVKNEQDA